MPLALRFAPLDKSHDRATFRSGEATLDEWFRKRAGQDERRNIARVFVGLDGTQIAGFYSLSSFSLSVSEVPEAMLAKLPRYDRIPAALIGRLARHEDWRGQGAGNLLLADAVMRTLAAARTLAVHAILVDAKNEAATAFYRDFGFEPFPSRPDRLFMLTSTANAALAMA